MRPAARHSTATPVRRWTEEEIPRFESVRERWGDGFAYEQSPIFLSQAMRRGGWVCEDSDGWMAVAEGLGSTGQYSGVVPLSPTLVTFLPKALDALEANGLLVDSIKHIPATSIPDLLQLGCFAKPPEALASSVSVLDDLPEDRFPQVVVPVGSGGWQDEDPGFGALLRETPAGSGVQDFRYQLRRFYRRVEQAGSSVELVDFLSVEEDGLRAAVERWVESIRRRFAARGWPLVRDYERCFVEPNVSVISTVRAGKLQADGLVILVDGVPAGLWISGPISRTCDGVYVLISDTRVYNLSYFTLLTAMLAARDRGKSFLTLGGSELESLFRFKKIARGPGGSRVWLREVGELVTVRKESGPRKPSSGALKRP